MEELILNFSYLFRFKIQGICGSSRYPLQTMERGPGYGVMNFTNCFINPWNLSLSNVPSSNCQETNPLMSMVQHAEPCLLLVKAMDVTAFVLIRLHA